MYLTYVWQPKNLASEDAKQRFTRILNEQVALYEDAWGRVPTLDVRQLENLLVGQLRYDGLVKGWRPWVESGNAGIVWGGVCEDFVDCQYTDADVRKLQQTLAERTNEVSDWDGRFFVASWDRHTGKLSLTTSTTENASLWYSEGQYGYAAGSRAGPILELLGNDKRISLENAGLLVSYGWLIGNGALFEGVERVMSRQQLVFDGVDEPRLRSYAPLLDSISDDYRSLDREGALSACAQRLVERVDRQLEYSPGARVLLTGGRDSRRIAAAARACGFAGPLHTGGPPNAPDVVIAKQVADRLETPHQHDPGPGSESRIRTLLENPARVETWVHMSEGMETLRHAVPSQGFFKRQLPFPAERLAVFHGAGGALTKGHYYGKGKVPRDVLEKHNSGEAEEILLGTRIGQRDTSDDATQEAFVKILRDFNASITEPVTVAQWLDLFFWQRKCLHWGDDMISVKSPMRWLWTPLADRKLMQIAWHVAAEDKGSCRFAEDMAVALAASLSGLGYGDSVAQRPKKRRSRLRSIIAAMGRYAGLRSANPARPRASQVETDLRQLFESVLLDSNVRVWEELVKESTVREIMRRNPNSDRLWNLATVELVARTHCS